MGDPLSPDGHFAPEEAGPPGPTAPPPSRVAQALEAAGAYLPLALQTVLVLVVVGQAAALRQSADSAAQAEVTRLALEDARQARSQWLDLTQRVTALQAAVDKRAAEVTGGGFDPAKHFQPLRDQLTGLGARAAKWEQQLGEARDSLKDLAKPDGPLAGQVAKKTAAEIRTAIEQNIEGRLTNLQDYAAQVRDALDGLARQLRRKSARQDVALVLSHARGLNARPLLPVVRDLLKTHPYRHAYSGYRLGVYVAAGAHLVPVSPLAPPGAKKPAGKPPPSRPNWNPSLGDHKPNDEVPQPRLLADEIFNKAKSPPDARARRFVFVLSTSCKPPEEKPASPWAALSVNVILIATGDPKAKLGEQATANFMGWDAFCRSHGGAAFLLRLPADGKLSPQDQQALALRVQLLISPLEPAEAP